VPQFGLAQAAAEMSSSMTPGPPVSGTAVGGATHAASPMHTLGARCELDDRVMMGRILRLARERSAHMVLARNVACTPPTLSNPLCRSTELL
jgi:hypothetical protein